jgi:hypothetical protein
MDLVKPGHRRPFHERGAIAMLYLITCLDEGSRYFQPIPALLMLGPSEHAYHTAASWAVGRSLMRGG